MIRLGCGAGYSGDRIEPAVDLAMRGELDYLIFECLAERTIGIAQQTRRGNPDAGYDPLLERRMQAVLSACRRNGTRIISNMGAANPLAAAQALCTVARSLGLAGLRVAAVTGDDVLTAVRDMDIELDDGRRLGELKDRLVSANAYLGAGPIVEALAGGADVVITGRVADAALFLAPMVHEFGWAMDDWDRLGRGTLAGHLLECAGQVTGGYFADPGIKHVADLAALGFPIAEVGSEGELLVTKLPGTGGEVTVATVTEQLLYEVHDPSRYRQPDVVADFAGVGLRQEGKDRVRASGATGTPKSGLLKVSIGYVDSYIGEGQISYAGTGAAERGRLALDIVRERLALTGVVTDEVATELIGIDALHGSGLPLDHRPYEVRARFAARTASIEAAARIGDEMEALYTNGPAGGGGAWKSAREVLAVTSALVPETLVTPHVTMMEA